MIQHLLAMLKPVPLHKLISEDLYEAQRDLLAASKNREYWESQERMLMSRVDRLEEELTAPDGSCGEPIYNGDILAATLFPPPVPAFKEAKTDPSFINTKPGHP